MQEKSIDRYRLATSIRYGLRFRRLLAVAVLVGCLVGLSPNAQGQGEPPAVETVVLSGQPVPEAGSGITFSSVFGASLNEAGQVAFAALFDGTDVNAGGIYRSEVSGEIVQLLRDGDQAPDEPSGVMAQFSFGPIINATGQTAFRSSLTGAGVDFANAIFGDGSGTLSRIVRDNMVAPAPSQNTQVINVGTGLFNNLGQSAFPVSYANGQSSPGRSEGILFDDAGTLQELVRAGNQAPNSGNGVVFSEAMSHALNDVGQVAFIGVLSGASVSDINDEGIFRGDLGSLTEVVREGMQAPGANSGVVFGEFIFGGSPAFNNAGQVAFRVDLSGPGVTNANDSGIYRESSGTLTQVARTGEQAPGASGEVLFDRLSTPVMNATGKIAFTSVLIGSGVESSNNNGIYSEDSGTLALIAREGDPAPGATDGATFRSFSDPAVNALGQVAFCAPLEGPGVSAGAGNNDGIYATGLDGNLVKVVRTGDLLDVSNDPLNEDLRQVSAVSFTVGSGNEDGEASGFNDLGQVAVSARFTDGSAGIFIVDINGVSTLSGDFDTDGNVDADDIDFYSGNLDMAATGALEQLDLDGDGFVRLADHDLHVTTLVQTSNGQTGALIGDINLDGSVDVLGDAFILVGALGSSTSGWSNGDLNASATVNVLGDAFLLVGNLGQNNNP